MNNSEKIKEVQKLLVEAHRVLGNVKFKDEEKHEAQTEVLSDINGIYKKLRKEFETSF